MTNRRIRASHVRRGAMLLVALIVLAACWELYKLVIPDDGVKIGSSLILPPGGA